MTYIELKDNMSVTTSDGRRGRIAYVDSYDHCAVVHLEDGSSVRYRAKHLTRG
jgi:hypothetical protein